MADIRKRVGKKGTTYQVRHPNKSTKSGYAFKSFDTLKEARAFREDSKGRTRNTPYSTQISTVEDGLQKWLEVCEKEGRDGRDPVANYTLKIYQYRADIIRTYDWQSPLCELAATDIVEFRSWLLRNYSRDQSKKALSSFHSMVLEMVGRGFLAHDIAAGVCINSSSRYDKPITVPTVADIQALLTASDRLANSSNRQIQKTWERYRPMLYLAADSGMRPQEYVVVPHYNIRDNGVEVDRALELGGGISVTKTHAGRRFIDLSTDTYEMVQYYAEHHAYESEYDLVFPTRSGKWQGTNNWRRRGFRAACFEAGLVVKVEVDGALVPLTFNAMSLLIIEIGKQYAIKNHMHGYGWHRNR